MTHPYRDVPQEITEHRVWLDVYMLTLKELAGALEVRLHREGSTRSEAWRARSELDVSAGDRARAAVCAFRQLHREAQRAAEQDARDAEADR